MSDCLKTVVETECVTVTEQDCRTASEQLCQTVEEMEARRKHYIAVSGKRGVFLVNFLAILGLFTS